MIDVCRRVDKGETDEKETEKIERNLGLSFNCFTKDIRLRRVGEGEMRSDAPARMSSLSALQDH